MCNFQNGYANNGGFLYISGNSEIVIENCIFNQSIARNEGGAIYAPIFKTLKIYNSSFIGINAKYNGAVLSLNFGTALIQSCNFTTNVDPSIIYLSNGNFIGWNLRMISKLNFRVNLNSIYGGAISAFNVNTFSLKSSIFDNFHTSAVGGAVYISMTTLAKSIGILKTPTHTITS